MRKIAFRISHGWSALKLLQVAMGGLILYAAGGEGHIPGILLGSVFMLAALLGNGQCCMGNTCLSGTTGKNKKIDSITETAYEELDTDK